jgi:DNA-binding beta-propeller fold protein YncE
VDSACHKVQKFDKECNPLLQWGEFGTSHGQFDSPWGITIDKAGDVYIADHKNHRVEKFSPQGDFISSFGRFGNGKGELNRPTDVAVDPDGDVYICDWLNNRVQMFDKAGTFLTSFIGDAQVLSKWAVPVVVSNPDAVKRRREVETLETEWRFCMPTGVTFDSKKNRLLVADTQRMRIQIYNKLSSYMEPQRNL